MLLVEGVTSVQQLLRQRDWFHRGHSLFLGLREREQVTYMTRVVPVSVNIRGRLFHRVLRASHRVFRVVHRLVSRGVVLSTRVVLAKDRYRHRHSLNHSVLFAADPTGRNVDSSSKRATFVESKDTSLTTVPGDESWLRHH